MLALFLLGRILQTQKPFHLTFGCFCMLRRNSGAVLVVNVGKHLTVVLAHTGTEMIVVTLVAAKCMRIFFRFNVDTGRCTALWRVVESLRRVTKADTSTTGIHGLTSD